MLKKKKCDIAKKFYYAFITTNIVTYLTDNKLNLKKKFIWQTINYYKLEQAYY
jgi:hypothetical protein